MSRASWLRRAAAFAVLVGAPRTAFAHTHLTRSQPAAGEQIAAVPTLLRFWYSEAPELAVTRIVLTDSTGARVALDAVEQGDSKLEVRCRIEGRLAAERFTVTWSTAALDGHPSHGSFTFRILPEAVRSAPPAPLVVDTASPSAVAEPTTETIPYIAARALSFAAVLSVVGVVLFLGGVMPRAGLDAPVRQQVASRIAAFGVIASGGVVLSGLLRLPLEAAVMTNGDRVGAMAFTVLLRTQWGWMLMLQALGAVIVAGSLRAVRRDRRAWLGVAAVGAVMVAATPAMSGHAAASEHLPSLAVVIDALHVIAASAWLGTLACVVLATVSFASFRFAGDASSSAVRGLVHAFSPLALVAAAIVVLTGCMNTWLRLGTLPALWTSDYGRVLLIKLATLCAVLATGSYNWLRVRPSLGSHTATRRLVRSAMAELIVGLGVIVITAVLVAMPAPVDALVR